MDTILCQIKESYMHACPHKCTTHTIIIIIIKIIWHKSLYIRQKKTYIELKFSLNQFIDHFYVIYQSTSMSLLIINPHNK